MGGEIYRKHSTSIVQLVSVDGDVSSGCYFNSLYPFYEISALVDYPLSELMEFVANVGFTHVKLRADDFFAVGFTSIWCLVSFSTLNWNDLFKINILDTVCHTSNRVASNFV